MALLPPSRLALSQRIEAKSAPPKRCRASRGHRDAPWCVSVPSRIRRRAQPADASARVPNVSDRASERDQCLKIGRLQPKPEAIDRAICVKAVRLVDWPVDWDAIFHPDRHPKLCRKLLILHGIFVPFVAIVQVLQQYLP